MSADKPRDTRAELVSPAGNLQKLKVAVAFGADAVYLSGKSLSLRAQSENFTPEQMAEGIVHAHANAARAFVLLNVFPHNENLEQIREQVSYISKLKPDAFVISDIGAFEIARENAPDVPIHISTQANVTNWRSARFWERLGASRIILARELTLKEIAEIASRTTMQVEIFVHGAMCMAYSGRCFMSKHFVGRDANLGDCAQPCRWAYKIVEETRPHDPLDIEATPKGTLIFSSRDLCMIDHIPEILSSGVNALKIEGRMKTAYYVGIVTRAYRQSLDANYSGYEGDPARVDDLRKTSNRDFTTGFYLGEMRAGLTPAGGARRRSTHSFLGLITATEANMARVEVRARIDRGHTLECVQPDGNDFQFVVDSLLDETTQPLEAALPNQTVLLPGLKAAAFSLLRKEERQL
ncbi:U32 family peptidase [Candidatus Poribacteria bacterium]|nr:U32 family peptidase [Candidatus Poribacteria bacterium]